jgi:hypothetical protein
MSEIIIEQRSAMLVNTDPQRRCYNGCHFSSKIVWSQWCDFEYTTEDKVERRLEFWRELNQGAVEARGETAAREFRIKHSSKETDA